jgi:hypothetical protein
MLVRVARLPSYIALTFAHKLVGLCSPMRYVLRSRRDIHNVRRAQLESNTIYCESDATSTMCATRYILRVRHEPDAAQAGRYYKEMLLPPEEPVQLTQQESDEFWSLIDTVWTKVCRWKHNSTAGCGTSSTLRMSSAEEQKGWYKCCRKGRACRETPKGCSLGRRSLSVTDENDAYPVAPLVNLPPEQIVDRNRPWEL